MLKVFDITPLQFFEDIETDFKKKNKIYISERKKDIETLYNENHEIFEKLLEDKDEQIAMLKRMLEMKK